MATIVFTPSSGAPKPTPVTVTSGIDGTYSVDLAVGRYTVTATSASAMSCATQEIVVTPASTATFALTCDTGMR